MDLTHILGCKGMLTLSAVDADLKILIDLGAVVHINPNIDKLIRVAYNVIRG